MKRVLIFSEDPELYSLLEYILNAEGFRARLITELRDISLDESSDPAVVILVAHGDTLALCGSITRYYHAQAIPIVALVPAGCAFAHTELLRAGVTECLSRPFNPSQLLDILHKSSGSLTGPRHPFKDSLDIDPLERTVTWKERTVSLSPVEFSLFTALYRYQGRVRPRGELLEEKSALNHKLSKRTIDVQVCRLRRTLKPLGDISIETIRSGGYRLLIQLAR
ncbi:hypothetical protein N185_17385 [Sinorhizobium sp. GW3]|nr:hypothetical protein N185_17385 [Sinorhizobium sp. GW3]